MTLARFQEKLQSIFMNKELEVVGNFISLINSSEHENQHQTNSAFSEKWRVVDKSERRDKEVTWQFQRDWYLKLYGFANESSFQEFLKSKKIIFDAGCGLGYKAAWFAKLAPLSVVIGMDFSESSQQAASLYKDIDNLFFVRGDIADTHFISGAIDYTSCDQVIMHTENPLATFAELSRITAVNGELACYFYAKKALPRELLDDYFRKQCKVMTNSELWQMSEQLTELGKKLSELEITFDCPDIPALGIRGGKQDIQRFIYWNFLKCFWNQDLGQAISTATNFDWYSPSNARRFSQDEVKELIRDNCMKEVFFHSEEACYSGRFTHA